MPLGNEAFFYNPFIDDRSVVSASTREANTIKILEYFDSQLASDTELVFKRRRLTKVQSQRSFRLLLQIL